MSEDAEDVTFISEQLDEFIEQFGVDFANILAVSAIIFGVFIAFLGSKGQGPKVLAFVAGFSVGAYAGALVLEKLDDENQNISVEVWVGGFFASGVSAGILCVCIVSFGKIIVGVAAGLVVAAALFQAGIADIIQDEIVLLCIVLVLCAISVFIAYKVVDLIYAIFASFFGGLFIVLGVGAYTNSPITVNLLTSDPTESVSLCQEAEIDCYIPLGIGLGVTVVSLVYNIFGFRKKQKKKKEIERARENNDGVVAQMREDREGFEAQLRKLEENNLAVLQAVNQKPGAPIAEQTFMMSYRQDMEKQEKAMKVLEEKLQEQNKKDSSNVEAIKTLQKEKDDLEVKMAQELKDLEEKNKLALLEAEMTPEQEKERKSMLLGFQQEAAEIRVRLDELDKDYKNAAKVEKKMVILLPKELKKKRFNFFEDDIDYALEAEEVRELKERVEEFQKLKDIVRKAKASQKELLKGIKKELKAVDVLNLSIRKLDFQDTGDDVEKLSKIKKEKEYAINDLTVKIGVVRSLMGRYEESTGMFLDLTNDMEKKVEEFKEIQRVFQEAAHVKEEDISMYPQAIQTESTRKVQQEQQQEEEEEGVVEIDPTLLAASAALRNANMDEVTDTESLAETEVGDVIMFKAPPPPDKVWRKNYFKTEPKQSNAELNDYLVRYIRVKYPNTLNNLNIFGKKMKTGVATAGAAVAQKTRDYRESKRNNKPERDLELNESDMEIAVSPGGPSVELNDRIDDDQL